MKKVDNETLKNIQNQYSLFRKKIIDELNNSKLNYYTNSNYLIKDSWEKKLQSSTATKYNFTYLNEPEFINDIKSAMDCFKDNQKLKLISKALIESLYEKDFLIKLFIYK